MEFDGDEEGVEMRGGRQATLTCLRFPGGRRLRGRRDGRPPSQNLLLGGIRNLMIHSLLRGFLLVRQSLISPL